jgi:hypothetical protein
MQKWINCKTCAISLQNDIVKNSLCNDCWVKNKKTYFSSWKNNKISRKIKCLFKENNVNLLPDDFIYDELLKSGLLDETPENDLGLE